MRKLKDRTTLEQLLFPIVLVLIDLAFEQGASDPLNPIKFWILGLFGVWSLSKMALNLPNWSSLRSSSPVASLTLMIIAFLILLFAALLFTPVKSIGLVGDAGRNLGFLNYLFLSALMIYAAKIFSYSNLKRIYSTVFFLAFCLSIYGFVQHFNLDFLNWNNQYNSIILMTGNPDFAASLLAIFTVVSFAALFIDYSKVVKAGISLIVALLILDIYWTKALQGLVGVTIGIGFILTIIAWQKKRAFGLALLALEIFCGLVSLLGTLQIGPMTKFLYKASVNDRGYNWRAAIEMFKHHPFSGVGVDRYGAYFLQYRSPEYPLKYGYAQSVTNAHNVFLQLFATAGLFVGLSYIFLICFIGYRAFAGMKKASTTQQVLLSGLVAGWLVVVAQSFISVDALVNSIWGWCFGGIIVALSCFGKEDEKVLSGKFPNQRSNKAGTKGGLLSVQNGISITFLAIFITVIVVPMQRNETATAKFLRITAPITVQGQNIYKEIAKSTFTGPLLNPSYKSAIAAKMAQNSFGSESIHYFKETIKADPRNTNSYSLLSLVYENIGSPQDAIPYRKELAKLDPYGAENLFFLEKDYLTTGDRKLAGITRDSIVAMAPGTDVANRAIDLLSNKVFIPKR